MNHFVLLNAACKPGGVLRRAVVVVMARSGEEKGYLVRGVSGAPLVRGTSKSGLAVVWLVGGSATSHHVSSGHFSAFTIHVLTTIHHCLQNVVQRSFMEPQFPEILPMQLRACHVHKCAHPFQRHAEHLHPVIYNQLPWGLYIICFDPCV